MTTLSGETHSLPITRIQAQKFGNALRVFAGASTDGAMAAEIMCTIASDQAPQTTDAKTEFK